MAKFFLPLVFFISFYLPLYGLEDRYQEQAFVSPQVIAELGGVEAVKEEFRKIALHHKAASGFPAKVLQEVEGLKLSFDGLTDLTQLAFITIDNDHSKDLDQAMNIEKVESGYRIHYAIADAAFFVKRGSNLDAWASKQVFTTYLPGFDLPVLPRILSEDLCSLKAGENRRGIVVSFTVTFSGELIDLQFDHAVIRSRRQLSYRLVQEYYDEPQFSDYAGKEYSPTLDHLKDVGEILLTFAHERGVVDGFDSELRVCVDDNEIMIGNYIRHRVERYNEQVSVMTNSLVADFIASKGKRSIHRYHQEPDSYVLDKLRNRLATLGFTWSPAEKLNDFVVGLDFTTPEGKAANMQVSRANYRAVYIDLKAGHSGLKLAHYDHFTAPMRRYPDIVVARILLSIIKGQKNNGFQEINGSKRLEIIKKIEAAAKREAAIEHDIEGCISSLLLRDKLGQKLKAQVLYVNKQGASLHIQGHPPEIWLSLADLKSFSADGNFQLSSDGMSLVSDSTKLSVLDWLSVHPARKEGESLKVILH